MRASRVRGTRWPLWLGTCPRAVVVAGGVPLWRASWPRVGAPCPVRSGRSLISGRLCRRCGAFFHPGGCRPRLYWVAARGTWRPAKNRANCACRWPLPRQGRWARSPSYPLGAPRWGCRWRVPLALVLGCVRCGCLRVWTQSLTRPVSGTVRLSTGDPAGAPGRFRVDADTFPSGSEDATPASRACVCACSSLRGRVGRPPGRVLVCLSFSCGRLLCALGLFGRLRAGVALFVVFLRFLFFLLFLFSFFLLLVAPPMSLSFCVLRPGVPWDLASCGPPPPTPSFFFVLFPLSPPPGSFFVFFPSCFLFVCCLLFFFVIFFLPCCAGSAVFGLVCVSWAVECSAVCCCGPCAPAGAVLRVCCVVGCPLVVPVLCVLLPV